MTKVQRLFSRAHVVTKILWIWKKILVFLAWSHDFKHITRLWSCIKWFEIYIEFNSFLLFGLELKLHYQEKKLNSTIMRLYKVVPNIRRIWFNFAIRFWKFCCTLSNLPHLILFPLYTAEFTSNLIEFSQIIRFDAVR